MRCASFGGPRAANWAVLREKGQGGALIVGGIHTSYCQWGCDALHACELNALYTRFEGLKAKYSNAPVVWMGDLNRGVNTVVVENLLNGRVGHRGTFRVDDLAKTKGHTYFNGGSAIDHIFGDSGAFAVHAGGRTGQGVKCFHLNGADHFPIFAKLQFGAGVPTA